MTEELLWGDKVLFYGARSGKFGPFSNFALYPFYLDQEMWATSDHYFQAYKFHGTDPKHFMVIWGARTPAEAAKMGRDRSHPLRKDWLAVKDDVMRRAIRAKFDAHDDIRTLLLSTCDREIIEDSPVDYYWGCGADKTGKNMLGILLMELRGIYRQEPMKGGKRC